MSPATFSEEISVASAGFTNHYRPREGMRMILRLIQTRRGKMFIAMNRFHVEKKKKL
jgi:hypothetical protein